MLISLEGLRKTAKSTFGLSAPPKIAFFDFDVGVDRVEPRYRPPEKNVIFYDYGELATINKKKQDAFMIAQWNRLLKDYSQVLEDEKILSIVFDTFTGVWELRRVAFLAKMRQDPEHANRVNLMPQEYAIPNADMKMLLVQAKMHHKNLILTHHLKEKYVEGKPSGEMEADGFKYTGDLVDVILHTGKKDNKPIFEIRDCGLTMKAEGLSIIEPTYEKVAKMINKLRTM